ncbi:neurofilament medium polypeptide-like [Sinocyclocheilus grahami]|uniref:neurofilament medium polypeptide-like n=1 Tax=Sinocyclocheilus grahami TaxID=75366 RepID=UPI0007ACE499|nr:PREDICTED: neurofilament medium polypeptide-like [Sinocyclocheilus grahami]
MDLCLVKDKQAGLPVEAEEAAEVAEGREEEEEEEKEGVEVTNKPVEVQTAKGNDGQRKYFKVQEEEEMEGDEDRGEEITSTIIKESQVGTTPTAL